ncbi:hypothetical protein CRYUN_Cryun02cG0150500 [Craigia yunnanensis]
MTFSLARYFLYLHLSVSLKTASARTTKNYGYLLLAPKAKTTKFTTTAIHNDKPQKSSEEELLVVVGGGAAGVYGAIRAKTVAPNLNVLVIEKGKLLSKVKISGGGRCNVTNGHCADNLTEDDGRVFPVSNNSSSVIDCLISEAKCRGVSLQTGKVVTGASSSAGGKFLLKNEKRTLDSVELVEADYLLIASGSSQQGHSLAVQICHSIIDPVPSLFTFKIEDAQLTELSGVTFSEVIVKLKLENVQRNIPQLTQACFFCGPAILRLSAWGARYLYSSGYKGKLIVDFVPDLHIEDLKSMLSQHKNRFLGQFKDEFVTAGGVPLSEIHLNTMGSRIQPNLYFAGEVLNVEGVTGGFNFQNAWSGGYIAGTSIGRLAGHMSPTV